MSKQESSKKIYFVVYDSPADEAWIVEKEASEVWQANVNERGWTYQDVAGSYGSIYGEFNKLGDAKAFLKKEFG